MNFEKWLKNNTQDLTNKTVVITGSTGGIGQELCKILANLGANLVLVGRKAEALEQQKAELQNINRAIIVDYFQADFNSLADVDALAIYLSSKQVDILIHNAGAYAVPRKFSDVGFDNVFQINFLSPYYLTKKLLPTLEKAEDPKVVVVGSIAHTYDKFNAEDIDFRFNKKPSKVYGNSKRFLMFTFHEWFREMGGKVKLSVVHPGITFTNITNHYPKFIYAIIKYPMKLIFMKPKKASLNLIKGIFTPTEFGTWIGPKLFNIWGLPKKKKLKIPAKESAQIYETSKKILAEAEERLKNNQK